MIRVFLIDDHAVLRAGLRMLIEAQDDLSVVGEAQDLQEALRGVSKAKPDVVVLDVSLQGGSGIVAAPKILEAAPQARVLVLSMHAEAAYLRAALGAGALGYLCKRSADTDLLAAIRSVARGERFLDRSFQPSSFEDVTSRSGNGRSHRGPRTFQILSPREREVFEMVAAGMTNRQIADRMSIGIKSIEKYRARCMDKLSLKNRAEIVRYALEIGLLAPGKSPGERE